MSKTKLDIMGQEGEDVQVRNCMTRAFPIAVTLRFGDPSTTRADCIPLALRLANFCF